MGQTQSTRKSSKSTNSASSLLTNHSFTVLTPQTSPLTPTFPYTDRTVPAPSGTSNNAENPPSPAEGTEQPKSSPDSAITTPVPGRTLNRISEIIDPRDILNDDDHMLSPSTDAGSPNKPLTTPKTPRAGIVHSPSGNALDAREFIEHPRRPLAMWERQERVLEGTRIAMERFEAESRAGNRSRIAGRGGGDQANARSAWGSCIRAAWDGLRALFCRGPAFRQDEEFELY
ncbi:hypothetical protein MMC28_004076 [Mycoblastus sanguinarius]|nr:hypothetical protein [Mycoblastus sanguinarius]